MKHVTSNKPQTKNQFKRFNQLAAGFTFILTLSSGSAIAQTVVNPISAFQVFTDGQFTNGVLNGVVQGEWSDVVPLAFISQNSPTEPAFRTFLGDPAANSLLYGAIAPGNSEPGEAEEELYLMYDYLPRTNPNFFDGEFVGSIDFPIHLPESELFGEGGQRFISVQVHYFVNSESQGGGHFEFRVVAPADENNPELDVDAESLGIEGAVGFGPSTLSTIPHLLIELGVPLRIPAGFGSAFPEAGINPETGLYSPEPQFWGSFFANDFLDPPASAAIFQINPNGTTTLTALGPTTAVPEPSTFVGLAFASLATISLVQWKRRKSHRTK